jgi:hypothetical protein
MQFSKKKESKLLVYSMGAAIPRARGRRNQS